MKRFVFFVLVFMFLLCVSVFDVCCFVTSVEAPSNLFFGGGSGTKDDPYVISKIEHLDSIRNNLSGYFVLVSDLDFNDDSCYLDPSKKVFFSTGEGWRPIGDSNYDNHFLGVFDGQGHVISNLFINRSSSDLVGLFGYAYGGIVKDIGLVNVNVSGDWCVGGLVGYMYMGNISGCYATGSVSGSEGVGGLVGEMYYGSVSGCYATGSVSGNKMVGGFVGLLYNSTVSNSYSRGNITRISGYETSLGGFVGNCSFSSRIFNSYSTGSVRCQSPPHPVDKGFAGEVGYNCVMSGNFWDMDSSGQISTAGNAAVKTTSEMKTKSTFTDAGWDFDNIWDISDSINDGYPYIKNYTGIEIGTEYGSKKRSNDIPGFELLTILFAFVVILFIVRRRHR
ncbi:MAG: GLUG motif-containing protein [Candidatus Thermoplasmatota archaeon]